MVRSERALVCRQVIELPDRQITAGEQRHRVPAQARHVDQPLAVGEARPDRGADAKRPTFVRKETYDLGIFLEDADARSRSRSAHGKCEVGCQERARQARVGTQHCAPLAQLRGSQLSGTND